MGESAKKRNGTNYFFTGLSFFVIAVLCFAGCDREIKKVSVGYQGWQAGVELGEKQPPARALAGKKDEILGDLASGEMKFYEINCGLNPELETRILSGTAAGREGAELKAVAIFQSLLKEYPYCHDVHFHLAMSWYVLNKPEAGRRHMFLYKYYKNIYLETKP